MAVWGCERDPAMDQAVRCVLARLCLGWSNSRHFYLSLFSVKLALFLLHLCTSLRWIMKSFKLIPFQLAIAELLLTPFSNTALKESGEGPSPWF